MSEAEKKFREKAGDQAANLLKDIQTCPNYFLMEGGTDGTFGHMRFIEEFGHLKPEIIDLAIEFGGEV